MKPFIPHDLPLKELNYIKYIKQIGKANAELARYDGLLQGIINPDILMSPLTLEEAVLSSKIEGTQATLDDVLEFEAGLEKKEEKYRDIYEIINYRKALQISKDHLKDYPITLHFIREIHKILLDSVRGQYKSPGEFRKDQNWIGRPGSKIEDAFFIPPSPLNLINYLKEWENYLNYEDLDTIIQIAIVHAQFEILHPFKDGNGRIGRILIPMFLYKKKILSEPMFYLSEYFEKNREEYYYRLRDISDNNNWDDWIVFFLDAVINQSQKNSQKVKKIIELYEKMKNKINQTIKSQYSIKIIDTIFSKPILSTTDFVSKSEISKQTASNILKTLTSNSILKILNESSGRRPAIYIFSDLLNICEGRNVF